MADVRLTPTIIGIATNPNDASLLVTLNDPDGGNGQFQIKILNPGLINAWAIGQQIYLDMTAVVADQTAIAAADPSLTAADTEN